MLPTSMTCRMVPFQGAIALDALLSVLLVVYKICSCRSFWFFTCVDYGNRFLSCPGTVINDRMTVPFNASAFIDTIGSH